MAQDDVPTSVADKLAELDRRVAELERRVGVVPRGVESPSPPAVSPVVSPPVVSPPVVSPAVVTVPAVVPPVVSTPAAVSNEGAGTGPEAGKAADLSEILLRRRQLESAVASSEQGVKPPPLPKPTVAYQAAYSASASVDRSASAAGPAKVAGRAPAAAVPGAVGGGGTWESVVGLKWTAWLGALVLVIGAGLGIKFAYDQGWMGGLPAVVRLGLWALASLGMIGVGEVVLRRVGRLASVGPFSAGVASLFLVAYAGQVYFQLYTPGVALGLIFGAVVVGSAIAMRADLVSVAVLSLLGAQLAPAFLGGEGSYTALVAYLLSLHGIALVLAGRGTAPGLELQRWWLLRGFSLGAVTVWVLLMWLDGRGMPLEAVGYAVLAALLAHAELVWTAARPARPGGPDEPTGRARLAVVYSTLVTLLPVAVVGIYEPVGSIRLLYAGLIGMGVLCGMAYGCRALAGRGSGGVGLIALEGAFRVKSLMLLGLGLNLGLTGDARWMACSGVALALGVFVAGRRDTSPDRPASRLFAALLPLAAMYHTSVAAFAALADGGPQMELLGTAWMAEGLRLVAAALGGQATAWLMAQSVASDARHRQLPWGLSLVATAGVVLGLVVGTSAALAALLLLGVVWAYFGVGLLDRYRVAVLRPVGQAAGLWTVAAVFWLLFVAVGPSLDPGQPLTRQAVLLNLTAVGGVMLAASPLAMLQLLRRRNLVQLASAGPVSLHAPGRTLAAMLIAAGLVGVVGLVEIGRAVEMAGRGQTYVLALRPGSAWLLLSVAWVGVLLAAFAAATRSVLPVDLWRSTWGGVVAGHGLIAGVGLVAGLVTLFSPNPPDQPTPFANLALVAGLVIVGAGGVVVYLIRGERSGAVVVAAAVSGWLLTAVVGIEWLRLGVNHLRGWGFEPIFSAFQLAAAWTVASQTAMTLGVRLGLRKWPAFSWMHVTAQWSAWLAAAGVGVVALAVPWPLEIHRYGLALGNVQALTAAVVLASLLAMLLTPGERPRGYTTAAWATFAGVLLVGSSTELARGLYSLSPSPTLTQAGYSVWWSVLAVLGVVLGFRQRSAALRYAGLALFGLTLAKVTFVDLARAGQGWRVVSFLGVGGLLVATSILYGKLAPRLLTSGEGGERKESAPAGGTGGGTMG